jgi:chromosome segregation ATPase
VVKGQDEGGSPLSEEAASGGLRARGEEALGDLAQALLENPLFNQALTAALGAGERAANAQRSAMEALNIPAASELERLEQRLRSLSNRLESVEDRLDDARDEVAALRRRLSAPEPGSGPGDEHAWAPEHRES